MEQILTNKKEEYIQKADGRILLQTILILTAVMLDLLGIIRILDPNRFIIYTFQSAACITIIFLSYVYIEDKNPTKIRIFLFNYAGLEALRAVLLNTTGINHTVGITAKIILIALSCTSAAMAIIIDKNICEKIAILMIVLETLLYAVFLIGFPGVLLGRLNRFLPLAGILIAISIFLVIRTRNEPAN
ncbi:hypothetical protein [Butyrivibrio sp. AC2005]|uniref:hypothetical protein n=1 Tax=Butyrivibrio sp. AC2005 TaxID=1280672 RepID=UPI0004040247|nr:hypothetical protein [Butyrivibrio sp. AC2005]